MPTDHVQTPKTHYAEYIELEADIPFLTTSSRPIHFSGKTVDTDGYNGMIATPWHKLKFIHSIPKSEKIKFPPVLDVLRNSLLWVRT